jgi:hypothetical protein
MPPLAESKKLTQQTCLPIYQRNLRFETTTLDLTNHHPPPTIHHPPVFGTDTNGYGWFDFFTTDEVQLKDTMMNYWGSFIKAGTPTDSSGYGE